MMEILVFSLNAIVIYLLADWIIREIEKRRGKVLKQRQVIFFVVFFAMALISFEGLRTLLAP
jgi:hypothetical protein